MAQRTPIISLALCTALLGAVSAQDRDYEKVVTELPAHLQPTESPALSPEEELERFEIADGFRIELVASEPLIEDPVAIDFDTNGRLWVVEMRGFMQDLDATGQFEKIGRIAVLEDTDGDGKMDHRHTWLDDLVLPRAIRCYRDGVLIAEHQKLWFTRDTNGNFKADEKYLVDPKYATSGSVEHRSNGLLIGLDNWIYNAKSTKRYRYDTYRNTWITESAENRGQWGITQDDFGRLFYNFNWSQLHCDLAPPNALIRNPHFRPTLSVNAAVTRDQRVHPIRMNTAVNRGYRAGVLDDRGRLTEFASACSPWIYRGGRFGDEFSGNAFVCAPGANTIKRNLVTDAGLAVSAANAYPDRDFLASSDERFRPVALSGGRDGALYVVDMYRGVIQQSEFMTAFLRRESERRQLAQPVHLGRIWRIVATQTPGEPAVAAPDDFPVRRATKLVELLRHPNAWWRERAQQRLVFIHAEETIPLLEELARDATADPIAAIHALWTLVGMNADRFDLAVSLGDHAHPKVAAVALAIANRRCNSKAKGKALLERIQSGSGQSLEHAFHGALILGELNVPGTRQALFELASRYAEIANLREAVLSGLFEKEFDFIETALNSRQWLTSTTGRQLLLQGASASLVRSGDRAEIEDLLSLCRGDRWQALALREGAVVALTERTKPLKMDANPRLDDERFGTLLAWPGHDPEKAAGLAKVKPLSEKERELFVKGQGIYASLCASCHGPSGDGMTALAPPLKRSEWVSGDADRLVKILLHGLEGEITVNGKSYAPPLSLPAMPPVGMMSDQQIAAVLTYVRRSWGHRADPISAKTVRRVRDLNANREHAWTADELTPSPLP